MIPTDLFVSLFVLAVAIYSAIYLYRVIRFSKLAPIGRALVFYLSIVAIDRMVSAIALILSVPYPIRFNNAVWCLYTVGISLLVWEICNYLNSIE